MREFIRVEVNSHPTCQYKCVDCLGTGYKYLKDPSKLELLHKLDKNYHVDLWLTGGEPLDHPEIVHRVMSLGYPTQMPSVGAKSLVPYFDKYPNFQKCNISIKGTPEYERKFRRSNDPGLKREWLDTLDDKYLHKLSIIHVIHRVDFQEGVVFDNLRYIGKKYPRINKLASLDRYDHLTGLQFREALALAKELNFDFLTRALLPCMFLDGDMVKVLLYQDKTDSLDFPIEQIEDAAKAAVEVFYKNKRDTMDNCDVWKYYDCGGPGCRFEATEHCKIYWRQYLPERYKEC